MRSRILKPPFSLCFKSELKFACSHGLHIDIIKNTEVGIVLISVVASLDKIGLEMPCARQEVHLQVAGLAGRMADGSAATSILFLSTPAFLFLHLLGKSTIINH